MDLVLYTVLQLLTCSSAVPLPLRDENKELGHIWHLLDDVDGMNGLVQTMKAVNSRVERRRFCDSDVEFGDAMVYKAQFDIETNELIHARVLLTDGAVQFFDIYLCGQHGNAHYSRHVIKSGAHEERTSTNFDIDPNTVSNPIQVLLVYEPDPQLFLEYRQLHVPVMQAGWHPIESTTTNEVPYGAILTKLHPSKSLAPSKQQQQQQQPIAMRSMRRHRPSRVKHRRLRNPPRFAADNGCRRELHDVDLTKLPYHREHLRNRTEIVPLWVAVHICVGSCVNKAAVPKKYDLESAWKLFLSGVSPTDMNEKHQRSCEAVRFRPVHVEYKEGDETKLQTINDLDAMECRCAYS